MSVTSDNNNIVGHPLILGNQRTEWRLYDGEGFALSLAINSSSKVVSSASILRLESDTFLLTMSFSSGGSLASRTGEKGSIGCSFHSK